MFFHHPQAVSAGNVAAGCRISAVKTKPARLPAPALPWTMEDQTDLSSRNVRQPENIDEMIDWRDMMSSRTAA